MASISLRAKALSPSISLLFIGLYLSLISQAHSPIQTCLYAVAPARQNDSRLVLQHWPLFTGFVFYVTIYLTKVYGQMPIMSIPFNTMTPPLLLTPKISSNTLCLWFKPSSPTPVLSLKCLWKCLYVELSRNLLHVGVNELLCQPVSAQDMVVPRERGRNLERWRCNESLFDEWEGAKVRHKDHIPQYWRD